MAKLYESGENYLETILILHKTHSIVHAVDIAREMDVSKPSVSRAMGILRDGGFIETHESGDITLTPSGREVAERIYERHTVLTQWLMDLGVSRQTAAEDACKIEHHISAESFRALKAHLRREHPNVALSESEPESTQS